MQLSEIIHTSGRVAGASRRLDKIALLAECLRRMPPEEIEAGTGFLTGDLRQGRLGVGAAALRNAAEVSGPAAASGTLTIAQADRAFHEIARTSGRGSSQRRAELLRELFGRATQAEREFLIRLVFGELRQGALEGVMVEAIARAAAVPARSVRRAAMFAGNLRVIARAALTGGAAGLEPFGLELFRPVQPMLAQTADDVGQALERIGEAALEFKLDGARVQVHKAADDVRVYSRSLKDVTVAVPELVEHVRRLPARELILDGEVLALRPDGTPHPFQTTMRRFGRRLDVEAQRGALPLVPYFFDCLWADGEPLVDRPAGERVAVLSERLPGELIIPRRIGAGADDGREFLEQALRQGHEGLMAKSLGAAYEAGQRGAGWLKIKPAHTLDLVVLAAEWGHGRRHGWLSNLHLGARDPASGGFAMLGKTFKGLTDEMLAWQTARLQDLEISRDDWTVYVRPELVVEVAFNNVQRSPHYASGLALRFARVKRYRADKTAAEADMVETVRGIFEREHRT